MELVAGVDTHKNTHHVAILDHIGRPVADREFRADGHGYAQVIAFLHAHGDVARVGVGRQAIGIPISVLAATLSVPYQRLRRLEIGTRANHELEARATAKQRQISPLAA